MLYLQRLGREGGWITRKEETKSDQTHPGGLLYQLRGTHSIVIAGELPSTQLWFL